MVNRSDINNALSSHRRNPWRPRRCRCGSLYPCGPRIAALDEQLRLMTREIVDWYPRYFANLARDEPPRMIPVARLRDPTHWLPVNPSTPMGDGHGDL